MLSSLYIKNYRNLKELQLDTLGQINLISGKNNTGKSSLLEAISLYANKGSVESIIANLSDRKEYSANPKKTNGEDSQEENIKSLSSLFFDRNISFSIEDRIEIGRLDSNESVTLRFVYYKEKSEKDENDEFISLERIIVDNISLDDIGNLFLGIEIKAGVNTRLLPLKRNLKPDFRSSTNMTTPSPSCQYIHTNNVNREINGLLFDAIALTDKEQYVIDALKIIEPDTERIAFVGNNWGERVAVIKLSGAKDVVQLSSMGDGINRILTIILALVNSANGFLLIDEFENGLHYTVQEQLWTIIFKLAKDLNIQVFATTHSNDCITSLSRALSHVDNPDLGKYIRLDHVDGKIKQVVFSSEEITIAEQQDIELR